MSIQIIQPGLFASVQDLGRYGAQKYGISVSGAMDTLALRIANILVGNPENEATIEVTMYGAKFSFKNDHLIAITGGFLHPVIDGNSAPMWRPILVRKGETLSFQALQSGCRAYIAFAGGLNIPKVMGSKSTYQKAKIGGYQGRALQKGDVITCGEISNTMAKTFMNYLKKTNRPFEWSVQYYHFYQFKKSQLIRVLKGSEYDRFTEKSKRTFVNETFTLTPKSDRLGQHFEGKKLQLKEQFELLSEGVTYGTIQVPASGKPIILMADRQTTGGYPKIAQVITVDLPKLAQLQPGNTVQFQFVSMSEAQQLLFEREKDIEKLKLAIQLKAEVYRGDSNG